MSKTGVKSRSKAGVKSMSKAGVKSMSEAGVKSMGAYTADEDRVNVHGKLRKYVNYLIENVTNIMPISSSL